jgi:ATP-dependent exoDNAse (exonuclease V) beta subunit
MLVFEPQNHKYRSIDNTDNTLWVSVTTLISYFKQPFDSKTTAKKSSQKKNPNNKWFGMTPDEIEEIWKAEAKRATDLGTWYHEEREKDLLSFETINRYNADLPIIKPLTNDEGFKIASSQKLSSGIYPEFLVYLRSVGICGQSDLVEVANDSIYITDYKTNKEIKTKSYVNWEGISQKMSGPVSHLEDCNYFHYALQLSVYMYMIQKHNPKLKPGALTLHHVLFETEGEDKFGYPIVKRTEQGDPIVKDVIPYKLPYLKDEVISILQYYKEHAQEIINFSKTKK